MMTQEDTRACVSAKPGAATIPIGVTGALCVALFFVLSIIYFHYRIPLWNAHSPILSTLLLGAELFGTLTLALHVMMTWRLVERRPPPPPGDYQGDIFVTTWNEPVELLRHTLLAARAVRRARTVWLLDDGCRPAMRALAEDLGVRYVERHARDHAKAGNLNHALAMCDARFIAVFDSDHAPAADFFERTLGYFIDERVAFVQTPQDFYNLDSIQHRMRPGAREAWHEQSLFYRVIQPGKDHWNATFFCGSCAVVRRAALDDIGGFATGTITEDFHTSVRLHARGWRSVFHAEPLAFGLSPLDLEQYATQRLRWGRGAMQVWRQERMLIGRGLGLAQWMCYFASTITYFEGWQKAVMYFLPAAVLITGSLPLIWTGPEFLLYFVPWFVSGLVVTELFGRGYAKTLWMEEYNLLRYFTFIRATLALVIPSNWAFHVTAKVRRDAGVGGRLMPQVVIAGTTVFALAIGSALQLTTKHLPIGGFWVNVFWALFNAALAMKALRFARRRSRQRRAAYRFLLPVPVRLHSVDATSTMVAQDISANGLRVHISARAEIGDALRGELLLPSGPVRFTGQVTRARADAAGVALGLALEWPDAASRDALATLLYGNSLQWDVNGWVDGGRSGALGWRRRHRRSSTGWNAASVTGPGERPVRCLARAEPGGWRVVAYGRPHGDERLRLTCALRDVRPGTTA